MSFEEKQNYYDLLEVSPDCTPQEIRDSYLRLKSTFSKDSIATYSIFETNDSSAMVQKIEVAFQTLSDPKKRKQYDEEYSENLESDFFGSKSNTSNEKLNASDKDNVVSIDRLPPMEDSSLTEDMLVAPSTDYTSAANEDAGKSKAAIHFDTPDTTIPSEAKNDLESSTNQSKDEPEIEELIEIEKDWNGIFIKKVRETRKISVEEMAEFTKVTRNYIRAIEDEDFSKLPAAVYLRGFLIQIAKKLQLPHDKVAASYVARYRQSCPDKS